MAHTLLSTRPQASAISRTRFSVRSVVRPELFLGQATHKPPSAASRWAAEGKRFSRSLCLSLNKTMTSKGARLSLRKLDSSGGSPRGAPTSVTRWPSLIPSFLRSGVPEYPAVIESVYGRASRAQQERLVRRRNNAFDAGGLYSPRIHT